MWCLTLEVAVPPLQVRLDDDTPPVLGVRLTTYVAGALEPVDHARDRTGGEAWPGH